jgi:hypothetical protein
MAGKFLIKGKYDICALLLSPNATHHMWEKTILYLLLKLKGKES